MALLPAATALAGRVLVTGHDADLHCFSGGDQCHFVQVAVTYVRGGAPDPNKPVLILDRAAFEGSPLHAEAALDLAFPPAGTVPRVVMDPRSPQFATAPITTDLYSAIIVASDTTCGGCNLNVPTETSQTPNSDAINARAADIRAFFNAGGGIYANAGASHGDGDPATGVDNYYGFLPLPVGGAPVQSPFTLTPEGIALGLTDQDANCCATHNSFTEPPAGSALRVAERDGSGVPETIIGEGRVTGDGGTIAPPGAAVVSGVAPARALPGASVAIAGAGFGATQGASTVTIGGRPAAVETWSDTRIVAFVPNLAAGDAAVAVTVGGTPATGSLRVLAPPGQAPIANIVVLPSARGRGLTVTFDATLSVDPDTGLGAPSATSLAEQQISSGLDVTWDFGDGVGSKAPVVNHTYAQPGDYSVRLRVTDRSNRTSVVTQNISVGPPVQRVVRTVRGVRRVVTIRRVPVFRPVNIRIPSQIVFDFGSAALRRESRAYLQRVSRVVRRSTRVTRVAGFTDSIGSAPYNLRLSRQRATAVRAFLASRGRVRPRLLRAVGFGEARPLATNRTEIGRQRNRRVVLTVQLRVGTRRI